MKKIIKDDNGLIGIILAILLFVFIVLFIGAVIQLLIGLLMLFGIGLILLSVYILYKKNWNTSLKGNPVFFMFFLCGILLILVSYMGLELAFVDLSVIPGFKELHMFINP